MSSSLRIAVLRSNARKFARCPPPPPIQLFPTPEADEPQFLTGPLKGYPLDEAAFLASVQSIRAEWSRRELSYRAYLFNRFPEQMKAAREWWASLYGDDY